MIESDRLALEAQGVLVRGAVDSDSLRCLLQRLCPKRCDADLVRLGPPKDGGYLVPNLLDGIVACFSPGVSTYSYFEEELLDRFNIGSHQADYSVEGPPESFRPLSFTKKFLGAHCDDRFMTLESWVKACWESGLGKDFILQMDIEGGEYDAVLSSPDALLQRFRVIVMELHYLEDWGFRSFFNIANALVSKLEQHFVIVHAHPNNNSGVCEVNLVRFPRVVELTLLRKDYFRGSSEDILLPHSLDFPCSTDLPEIFLEDIVRKK